MKNFQKKIQGSNNTQETKCRKLIFTPALSAFQGVRGEDCIGKFTKSYDGSNFKGSSPLVKDIANYKVKNKH
jgi:hypothetical protein